MSEQNVVLNKNVSMIDYDFQFNKEDRVEALLMLLDIMEDEELSFELIQADIENT